MALASPHRVVIVGGGFGGLYAAQNLAPEPVRRGHARRPAQLPPVPAAALPGRDGRPSPGDIAQPLRSILRKHRNTTRPARRGGRPRSRPAQVLIADGGPIDYDTLVVATGARHAYFGHDEWAPFAPGLKSIEDALEIRRRILIAFEAAEREADPEHRREWMTFVVVGGGPTGVELAGALGEIAHDTLRSGLPDDHPPDARILLIEALDRVLPTYPPELSRSAANAAREARREVRTGTRVVRIDEHGVTVAPRRWPRGTHPGTDRALGGGRAGVAVRAEVAEATGADRIAPAGSGRRRT